VSELRVTLRPYSEADEDAAIELWRHTWQQHYPHIDFANRVDWWRERWRNELVPAATVSVAEADGRIVGFVTVDCKTGYLDQIVVAPEVWGSDAATMLMDEARRISPSGLDLKVNVDNARAIRFYEKQGFIDVGETVNEISGAPVRVMRWRP
jgi:putative acetyltransferase